MKVGLNMHCNSFLYFLAVRDTNRSLGSKYLEGNEGTY